MSAKTVFFDTNILVYAFDKSEPDKQAVATSLIRQHIDDASGAISSQVVQEFCNVALRKFKVPMQADELDDVLRLVMEPLWRQSPNVAFYRRVNKLLAGNSLSFYDACIVQAAIDLGSTVLYSEDLHHGRRLGGLVISNPFLSAS